jgi:hypothetical protein
MHMLWELPPTPFLGRLGVLRRLWLVEVPHPGFHFFAWLETHEIPWWDVDDVSRSRISGNPTVSSLDLKYSKIPKFDPALFDQCIYDCVECGLNRFLRLRLGEI